jgi:hypothetical protein
MVEKRLLSTSTALVVEHGPAHRHGPNRIVRVQQETERKHERGIAGNTCK